jgi:hypothetical protein
MKKVARTKSVPDEGLRSIDRRRPLIRLSFAKPPSPTRGEGKGDALASLPRI